MNLLQITSYSWLMLMVYWVFAGLRTKITVKKQTGISRYFYLSLMFLSFALVYSGYFHFNFLGERFLPHKKYVEYLGLILNVAGCGFAIIARRWLGKNWSGTVTIKKDHELIETGPYSVTRHPIYTGMLFGLAGAVLVQGELRGLMALIILFAAIQIKTATEEKFLEEVFINYNTYVQRTRKLIPFIY